MAKKRGGAGRKVWWSLIYPVGLVVLSFYLASFVVSAIFAIIPGDQSDNPAMTMVGQALIYALSLWMILCLPAKVAESSKRKAVVVMREELGVKGWPTWTDIGLAPVGLIVYYLIAMVVTRAFMIFPWFQVNEAQDVGFSTYIFGVDRLIAFFALCVVAPVMEELIFRGFLYGKIRNGYRVAIATAVVSLLFGFLHGQWNVGVNVAVMSVVMCGMREVTGTIYAGTLLHMMKNFVAFMLIYVLQV